MEYYIGLISGTSMDAVDAVLVDYSTMPGKIIERHSEPIHADLKNKIFQLISSTSSALPLLGKLDVEIGKLFAQTVNKLILKSKLKKTDIVAIGSHGQTVWHEPWGENPFTLQIGDPNIIAEETGITTVADFRRRDIAVGGQGAPLVPVFHETLFRTDKEDRVVLNLGGIANISVLPMTLESPIIGFDTGPANILCDSWIQRHSNKPYDENGCWALSGSVSEKLLTEMLADNYFNRQYPKSTGREYFNIAWVDQFLQDFDGYLKPEDVQATLVELTALTVQKGIELSGVTKGSLYVCGGGEKNRYLMERIRYHVTKLRIFSTTEVGVPAEWMEALAFAWLARCTINRHLVNLTSVTGANKSVILGGVYSGAE